MKTMLHSGGVDQGIYKNANSVSLRVYKPLCFLPL